ncbi:MAG TPA: hypothetical protein VHP83_17100 [Aggregatilineaceae bacterium]|nr:hypothetical protein [Aggregatilineaceae bacterium]
MNETSFSSGGVSWFALIIGIALGIGLALFYTWEISPVVETNTGPGQLSRDAREDYVVAVAMSYAYNHNIELALNRLLALNPDRDVWQMVADITCERHRSVKITVNSDVVVMRAMEQLYRAQGASGCADGQYPTPAPLVFNTPAPMTTQTPIPTVPTKTPTPPIPTETALPPTPISTQLPSGGFVIGLVEPYCDPDMSGIIEVRVYDPQGLGIAGMPVEVIEGGSAAQTFYTGLKPGREPEYADYQMTEGKTYIVSVPGLISNSRTLEASPCEVDVDGRTEFAITSYRISFMQQLE